MKRLTVNLNNKTYYLQNHLKRLYGMWRKVFHLKHLGHNIPNIRNEFRLSTLYWTLHIDYTIYGRWRIIGNSDIYITIIYFVHGRYS